MNMKQILLTIGAAAIILISVYVFYSYGFGNIHLPVLTQPSTSLTASLSITPGSISVQSNKTSDPNNPITIRVINVQGANNTAFNIALVSSNGAQVYPVYYNGTPVVSIKTTPLIGVEPYTSPAFRVAGKLPQGITSSAGYAITANLYYQGKLLDSKSLQVTVTS
jgi:hypothetical protein